ncbi:MAG: maleylacetoacetate isomerase [Thauera sp.]|nr:maleylacetoacetate isomerase [Thauera sp.]
MVDRFQLYGYWRSSAAYRVRIALNLKGLEYEQAPVHLARDGGEQHRPEFLEISPQAQVPVLRHGARLIRQSLAIIEYLEESHPQPALLPAAPLDRARVRAIAQAIACDIHPVNNLRVLQYLTRELDASEEQKNAWYRHWIGVGLQAVEAMLAGDARTGAFCHGDTPGLADCCLVPQVFNARRFGCELSVMPTVLRIADTCAGLEAFHRAAPEAQPDVE